MLSVLPFLSGCFSQGPLSSSLQKAVQAYAQDVDAITNKLSENEFVLEGYRKGFRECELMYVKDIELLPFRINWDTVSRQERRYKPYVELYRRDQGRGRFTINNMEPYEYSTRTSHLTDASFIKPETFRQSAPEVITKSGVLDKKFSDIEVALDKPEEARNIGEKLGLAKCEQLKQRGEFSEEALEYGRTWKKRQSNPPQAQVDANITIVSESEEGVENTPFVSNNLGKIVVAGGLIFTAGTLWAASALIAADDATGIGVADDPALLVTIPAAGAATAAAVAEVTALAAGVLLALGFSNDEEDTNEENSL